MKESTTTPGNTSAGIGEYETKAINKHCQLLNKSKSDILCLQRDLADIQVRLALLSLQLSSEGRNNGHEATSNPGKDVKTQF